MIPEDGAKDVFIHKSCLERHGMDLLIPGQKVQMMVRSVSKGREVLEFEMAGQAKPEEMQAVQEATAKQSEES